MRQLYIYLLCLIGLCLIFYAVGTHLFESIRHARFITSEIQHIAEQSENDYVISATRKCLRNTAKPKIIFHSTSLSRVEASYPEKDRQLIRLARRLFRDCGLIALATKTSKHERRMLANGLLANGLLAPQTGWYSTDWEERAIEVYAASF